MQNKSKPVRLLTGDRVYLRPLSQEDAETYFQQLFDPEVRRLTGTTRAFTKEGIQRYIDAKSQDSSTVLLLICLKDTDEVIGDIALQDLDPINRNCNIRIAIESEYQGKGYGSEAMPLMLDYGFGILNMHRIELEVFSYNTRALKMYEKLGFTQEGIQRDYLYYNHKYHDCIKMSILEDEFREIYIK
jgi:RimJ/RimL family protein N-acetyltransferase